MGKDKTAGLMGRNLNARAAGTRRLARRAVIIRLRAILHTRYKKGTAGR